jgi:hypothetical protein
VTLREEMRRIIGGQAVRCELNDERSHERVVCVCRLPDGTDTGTEIIGRAWRWTRRTEPSRTRSSAELSPSRRVGMGISDLAARVRSRLAEISGETNPPSNNGPDHGSH